MIYIPKRINVGFQERSDTYTKKLAYIIYYDEHGKLRKEPSWNNWRDHNIPNEEYDNEPTSGFVLNKKVGGTYDGWNPRQTYTRIYDPRGYEFEITIPNLLYILENCNCIRGKGLDGEFVYGWDGKDLILIPVDAPEYKHYKTESDQRNNAEFIKAKDLVVGNVYRTMNGEEYVYLGRYDKYEYDWVQIFPRKYGYYYNQDEYTIDVPKYLLCDTPAKCNVINAGKHYFFMRENKSSNNAWISKPTIYTVKSISRKFVDVLELPSPKYPQYDEELQHACEFSPIDFSHVDTIALPFKNFVATLDKIISIDSWWSVKRFLRGDETCTEEVSYIRSKKVFQCTNYYDPLEVGLIYERIRPVYKIFYLMNGKEYGRRYYYNEDGD